MAKQIILTQNNFGIPIELQFVSDTNSPIDLTDKTVEVAISYDGIVIDVLQAIISSYTNGTAYIIVNTKHTSNVGLYTTFWSVRDKYGYITAQEDLYYYVKEEYNGAENNGIEQDKVTIEEKLYQINSSIEILGKTNSDISTKVSELETKINVNQSSISIISNNITNLTDRITTLENSGGSGGDIDFNGNAEDVTYNNPNYSELTSVDLALDKILDKLYYVKPSITSFNMSPSTTQYEKGQTISNLSFAWSYNKNITSQSLSNCNITLSDRRATCNTPITSNKSFTLTCSDGENTVSASKNITFFDKIYWGSKDRSSLDSEFILSLSDSKFATAKAGTYSMTIGTGEYGYIAIPSSFGELSSVWIGGFEATVLNRGEIDFTNASGYTSKYKIYRTGRSGLGSITMQIK